MTLKSSDKALLLGIVGVAIAVLAIIYVAKPNIDTMNSVKAENEQLQARLNELNQKQANRASSSAVFAKPSYISVHS